jgi:hypothetical protein
MMGIVGAGPPEIERIAESLPRADVRLAILGLLRELLDLIVSLTPIEQTVQVAIEDLQHRESLLTEREARLVEREQRAARVDEALTDLRSSL